MKNKFLSLTLSFITASLYFSAFGICADQGEHIRAEAEKISEAFLKDDFDIIAQYTLPAVVDLIGGKDNMVETLKVSKAEMKKEGVSFDSVKIGSPSNIQQINGKTYALIPQTIRIKVKEGILVQESYLIAVSSEDNRWYFVDSAALTNDATVAQILPDIVGKIEIPARQQPTLLKNP